MGKSCRKQHPRFGILEKKNKKTALWYNSTQFISPSFEMIRLIVFWGDFPNVKYKAKFFCDVLVCNIYYFCTSFKAINQELPFIFNV